VASMSPHHGTTPDKGTALLWTAAQVADALGVSVRLLYKLQASGRLPRPISFGRAVRWRREELEEWLAAGAPERSRWEAMRGRMARS
jgi:excisionase family DNA binding protein